MKRRFAFINLLIILAIIIIAGLNNAKINFTVQRDIMHLLSNPHLGRYEVIDINKVECDFETYSYIINAMRNDGYSIQKLDECELYVETLLCKNDLQFRLHYDKSGILVSICRVYEKSYMPLTYINENLNGGEKVHE